MLRQVAENGLDLEPLCSGQAAVVLVVGSGWVRDCLALSVYLDAKIIPVLD
jgi:hypothetical protein